MAKHEKYGLHAGWKTAVIQIDTRDPADALEANINDELARLESEAWSAGFRMDVKSVNITGTPPERAGNDGLYAVILYRLDADPSFRPPM